MIAEAIGVESVAVTATGESTVRLGALLVNLGSLCAQNPDMSIRAIARETEVPYATTRRLLLEREKPPGN